MNKVRIFLVSVTLATAAMSMGAQAASAQQLPCNCVPMDPNTLPQVPGCQWFPSQYQGQYEIWCGSDELGWYRPYEWYQLTGIWPPDYGLSGG